MKTLPDFIVIGAMKSGSSTLHQYLDSHPDIYMSTPKEPRFFSLDENYSQGMEFYAELFNGAGEHQLAGEASTCYSRWPHHPTVVDRIHEHIPAVKLIYIVRDPVERVYSHYKHRMEERFVSGLAIPSFRQAIDEDPEILDTGLYAMQVDKYLEKFDSSQLHIIIFEELKKNPEQVLANLSDFLEVEFRGFESSPMQHNESGSSVAYNKITDLLKAFRRLPVIAQVVDLISPEMRGRVFLKLRAAALNSPLKARAAEGFANEIPEYADVERERMVEYYSEPNKKLAKDLGVDISHWVGLN